MHGFYIIHYQGEKILSFAGHGLEALILDILYGLSGIPLAYLLIFLFRKRAQLGGHALLWQLTSIIIGVFWVVAYAYSAYLTVEVKHIFLGSYNQFSFLWWEQLLFLIISVVGWVSLFFQLKIVTKVTFLKEHILLSYIGLLIVAYFGAYIGVKDFTPYKIIIFITRGLS